MFLEHDDLYTAGGHQHLQFAPEGDRPAGGLPLQSRGDRARSPSVSAPQHPGFAMTPREIIDWTLQASGCGDLAELGGEALARSAAAVRGGAFPRRLRLPGRKVPLQAGLDARRRSSNDGLRGAVARHARPARPLAGQRGRRRASTRSSWRLRPRAISSIRPSPRRRPRALRERRPDRADPPRRRRPVGDRRRRRRPDRQRRAGDAPAREAVLRARSAGVLVSEGVLAAFGLSRRLGVNAPDRRRQRRAFRRRRLPRRDRLGATGADGADVPRPLFAGSGGIYGLKNPSPMSTSPKRAT